MNRNKERKFYGVRRFSYGGRISWEVYDKCLECSVVEIKDYERASQYADSLEAEAVAQGRVVTKKVSR